MPDLHGEDGTHSTVHPGGSGCPTQDAQTSSKSAETQPAQRGYNNNPEYTNTQQVLPDYGIYLADSYTCKAVWLWSYFAEKLLIVDPYF